MFYYLQCKTEKTKEQQRKVEDALLQCMQQKLLEDVTIVELCQKAGITRRIFYRLYSNKLGALVGLLDHTIGQFVKSQEQFDRIRLVAVLSFVKEHHLLFDCIIKNGLSELYQERLQCYVMENDHLKGKLGYFDKYDGYSVLLFNLSGMMGLLVNWHRNGYDKSINEMADLIVRLLAKPTLQ